MIPRSIERILKKKGHQVIRPPLSMSNSEIISMASVEDAIIITADKDFIAHVSKEYDYVVQRVVILAKKRDWRKITRAFAEKFDEIMAGFQIDPLSY